MPSPARLLLSSEHFATAAATAPPPTSLVLHSDTFLILAALLCFLLCVVGLALVARCSRLCNPSAFSVDAPSSAALPPSKGLKKKALHSLPTVSFADSGKEEEPPECAICLAEFADGDEIRVLPPCGHGFHVACVDVWLLSRSTCPSCRRVLVVAPAPPPSFRCRECSGVAATVQAPAAPETGAGEHGGCRTSLP